MSWGNVIDVALPPRCCYAMFTEVALSLTFL
jgi:hypothetical protein